MPPKTTEELKEAKEEKEREKVRLTKLADLAQRQFEEQCFLTDNIETILSAKFYKEEAGPAELINHPTAENQFILARIYGPPHEVINSLVSRKKMVHFLEASPAALAALVPHFRLFKIQYDKFGRKVEEHEFPFVDHYANIDEITTGGKIHGVGLKSFSYSHDSSTPGMLKTIKATIILHFQNFESLVVKFAPVGQTGKKCSKMAYFDLLRYANYCEETKDLGNITDMRAPGTTDPPRNSAYFRIRAYIGHRGLPEMMDHIPDGNNVLEAAQETGYTMFLEMVNQQLKFNQNGSLDLTIDFQGALERAFNNEDTNILAIDRTDLLKKDKSEGEILEDIVKANAKKQEKAKKERDLVMRKLENYYPPHGFKKEGEKYPVWDSSLGRTVINHCEGSWEFAAGGISFKTENYSKWFEKLKTVLGAQSFERIAKFLTCYKDDVKRKPEANALIAELDDEIKALGDHRNARAALMRTSYDDFIRIFFNHLYNEKRLFAVDVDKKLIIGSNIAEHRTGPKETSDAIKAASTPYRVHKKATERHMTQVLDLQAKQSVKAQIIAAEKGVFGNIAERVSTEANNQKLKIQFFFFGDLLDAALKELAEQNRFKKESMLVATGPIVFLDPRSTTGAHKSVNIADIPISLNVFTRWWVETVVLQTKRVFTLQQFISSAIENLIVESLGRHCVLAVNPGLGRIKVKMANITLRKVNGKHVIPSGGSIHIDKLRKNIRPIRQHTKGKNFSQLLLIYGENIAGEDIPKGTEKKDQEVRGIYHLTLGQDRGIVKKMDFSALEQKYGKEAKAESNDDLNANALPVRYKCEVVLVGTAIFQPGMQIYLKPAGIMGSKTALALNLEGYYAINTVEGILENGKFETILNTVWISSGTDKKHAEISSLRSGMILAADQLEGPGIFEEPKKPTHAQREEQAEKVLKFKKMTTEEKIAARLKSGKFPVTIELLEWVEALEDMPPLAFTDPEAAELEVQYYEQYQLSEDTHKEFQDIFFSEMLDLIVNAHQDEDAPPYGHWKKITLAKGKQAEEQKQKQKSFEIAVPEIKTLNKKQQKRFAAKYKKHFKTLLADQQKKGEEMTDELMEQATQSALEDIGASDEPTVIPPEPEEVSAPEPGETESTTLPPHTVDSTGKFVTLGDDPNANYGALEGLKIPIKYFPLSNSSKSKIQKRHSALFRPLLIKYPEDWDLRPELEQIPITIQKEIDEGKIKLTKAKK